MADGADGADGADRADRADGAEAAAVAAGQGGQAGQGGATADVPGGSPMRARLAGGGLLSLLGLLLLFQIIWIARHCDDLRPVRQGDLAPLFTVERADGRGGIDLGGLRGKVVLIDFWATWCRPCRETMPIIADLHRRFHDSGFEVLSINVDGTANQRDAALAFASRHGLPFPVYLDDGRVSALLYKVESVPHLVLVDKLGRIRVLHASAFDVARLARELDERIRALLAEP